MCEISASSWFYYKEICYDAQSHERKITHYSSPNLTELELSLQILKK